MIIVRGCAFPHHLLYDVANHIWHERLENGHVRIGMTSVAIALSGEVLAFTPKRVGFPVEAGRSCATIESGKWVGPARTVLNGVVAAVNQALIDRPSLVNRDPYGEGWMVVIAPADDAPLAGLVSGNAIADAYEAWMAAENFSGCGE